MTRVIKDVDKQIAVFDNDGRSFDRYTVIYLDYPVTDDPYYRDIYWYVGMSERPCHPQGFGQHGEIKLDYNVITQLRRGKGQKLMGHLGERIKFNDLPYDCKQLVLSDLSDLAEVENV